MGKVIKFLFVGLQYLKRNYGAQGIAFPLIEKLSSHFDAEYTFVISRKHQRQEHAFLEKRPLIKGVTSPDHFVILGKCNVLFTPFYPLIRRRLLSKDEKATYLLLVNALKESDVVIDLPGIEFIGNLPLKRRYSGYLNTISMQWLAEKYDKIYLTGPIGKQHRQIANITGHEGLPNTDRTPA